MYIFDEYTKYEFQEKGIGALYLGDEKYEYTYKVKKETLKIDYKDEEVRDATYTYKLEGEELKLIGGEGTVGGEYTLKKESK